MYDARRGTYEDLCTEVDFAIGRALEDRVKVHSRPTRVKTKGSFLEKLKRKKKYADPLVPMPDLVGARIVCLFLEDIKEVETLIYETFAVLSKEDKTRSSTPETFQYQSIHFECTIREDHAGPHYDHIKGIPFEIQVRTILQDAWAVAEHTLAYKGAASIPPELRRDFSALVGLFHIADKAFQQLRKDSELSEEAARKAVEEQEGLQAQEELQIDRNTLKARLRQFYPDRKPSNDIDYAQFADELTKAKVRTLGEFSTILLKRHTKMLEEDCTLKARYEPETLESDPLYFSDIGAGRSALKLEFPDFWITPYNPEEDGDDPSEEREDDED